MTNHSLSFPEPAVSRPVLLYSAGVFWLIGAGVLIFRGYEMLTTAGEMILILTGVGLIVGVFKYHFILSRTVKSNADRIRELSPHKARVCIFAFQSLQGHFLVLGMVGIGFGLRVWFDSPKTLGTIYISIGAALILGAWQYFGQARKTA